MAAGDRRGQSPLSSKHPVLDDRQFLKFRHRAEIPALLAALGSVAVLLTGAHASGAEEIVYAALGVWFTSAVTSFVAFTRHRLSGAEVTATQFPELHEVVEELRQRFHVPATRVFLYRDPYARSYSYGLAEPFVIVLSSALVDTLTPEEVRCEIARHMGHIRFGHTRVDVFLGGDEGSLPGLLAWTGPVRNLFFGWYQRLQVMSADRISVLACRNVQTVMRTRVKLAVGSCQGEEVRFAELVANLEQIRRDPLHQLQARYLHLLSNEPVLLIRLLALAEWAGLSEADMD
jgi:Zn-dependent protease with chaperone function